MQLVLVLLVPLLVRLKRECAVVLTVGDSLRFVPDPGKVRFLDDREQRALQVTLHDMARDVVDYCHKLGLKIMLGGGSCLGAVRHKGFIPWDDDLDLNIPRGDFEVLVKGFNEHFAGRYVMLVAGRTSGYTWRIPQIRKVGTHVRDFSALGEKYDGAFLDLFIIESTPRNAILRVLHGSVSMVLQYLLSSRRYWERRKEYSELEGIVSPEAMKAVRMKSKIGALTALCPFTILARAADRVNGWVRSPDSTKVTIPTGRKFYFGEIVDRTTLLPESSGEFCGSQWPLPADPDRYLSHLYGNYKKIPSEGQRERHFFLKFELNGRDEEDGRQVQSS